MKIGQAVSEELVGDFSEYSEFYKVSGDPVFQFLFCKVKNQKLFGWVWFALWIALSVFFIVEFGFGDGHMPLVVKAIVIGAVLVFLWYDLSGIVEKERDYWRKREDSFKFTCCREKMDHIGENARKIL